MKKIILLIFFTVVLFSAFAQFNGILNYENDYSNFGFKGKVITTIYQSGSKDRIESINTPQKDTAKSQDVLLYDFTTQKQITLQAKRSLAVITQFTAVLMQQQQMMQQMGTTVSVQKIGNEKVGSYNCIHFIMTTSNPKIKNTNAGKKDIWITTDPGSCNIWYVGPYLYYPSRTYLQQQLANAGADGVVVKWQSGAGTSLESTGMLMSYQSQNLRPGLFSPPSGYAVVDNSNFQMPPKKP